MKTIFFFLPDYPLWTTGGHKYHTILFEYVKKIRADVYSFGHSKYSGKIEHNRFLKIISGIFYTIRVPKHSIIIATNASFLTFCVPVFFNRFWKNHFYFLIVHHLVQDERPSSYRKFLENYFIKRAGKVITVSKFTQKKIYELNLDHKSVEIFNPGLDVPETVRNSVKIFPEKLRLLYVGSIDERKGILYLIEALKFISFSDFEFNIIGEDKKAAEYYASLLSRTSEMNLESRVIFRGKVSGEELDEYYRTSSIFVFPSLWEGYGMVVAEAMAYGLPSVVSRLPSIEEFMEDNVEGCLVDTRNSLQIAEKLDLLYTDRRLLLEMSLKAKLKSLTFPDWNQTCKGIYDLISKIN